MRLKAFVFQYTVFIALCFFALYLPLSFAGLSFNPVTWHPWERFLLAMVIWAGSVSLLFTKAKGDGYFKV